VLLPAKEVHYESTTVIIKGPVKKNKYRRKICIRLEKNRVKAPIIAQNVDRK